MLSILASGTLTRDPQERTTSKGKSFATALLRVPCDDAEPVLVPLICFNADVVQVLLALSKGDTVAVVGRAKLSTWERDGEQRTGLSLVAEQILSPYQLEKCRQRSAEGAHA